MHPRWQAALDALRCGTPVLLYDADGREEETDMVVPSQAVTPAHIQRLRKDAGGLLCTTLAPEHHTTLGLPWATDILSDAARHYPVLEALAPDDIRYDPSRPAFGITLNHRHTYTGITDQDRAHTIRSLAHLVSRLDTMSTADAQAELARDFRSPGHCILLNGALHGLADRQGHTELSIELMRQAGLTPSATICEMMDDRTGEALGKDDAEAYAAAHGLVFLTGEDVLAAWRQRTTTAPDAVRTSA